MTAPTAPDRTPPGPARRSRGASRWAPAAPEEPTATGALRTPVGVIRVVASARELLEVGFACELRATERRGSDAPRAARALRDEALRQLREYLAGRRRAFDLPLAPAPTPFQAAVRRRLLAVPYGGTVTYGELAAELGRPAASRAVGGAAHCNPLGVVVPCHRLVGRGGALTGYAGGLARKAWLLAHERRWRAG